MEARLATDAPWIRIIQGHDIVNVEGWNYTHQTQVKLEVMFLAEG